MFKKITLIFLLIFSLFIGNNIFADYSSGSSTKSTSSSGDSLRPDDIMSKAFVVDTNLFSVGGSELKGGNSETTINNTLGKIIQKLMIALGVISLFIMTIGAGYIILYHGQDEFLTKGKNIFIAGITSLIIALSSYYLVNLVGYLIYK